VFKLSESGISPRIFEELRDRCKGDPTMLELLEKLILAETGSQSPWKENYRRMLSDYSERWSGDED